jgi:Ca2+-binding EF-hand superfamily protein
MKTDMLYNLSREKSLRRIMDIENKNREEELNMREKKVLTEETLKVVEDVRERRIEELFRKFDYDYDGLIKVEEDG